MKKSNKNGKQGKHGKRCVIKLQKKNTFLLRSDVFWSLLDYFILADIQLSKHTPNTTVNIYAVWGLISKLGKGSKNTVIFENCNCH